MPDLPTINLSHVTNNIPLPAGPMSASFLTPDALMSYCSSRIRSLDEAAQKQFASQQSNNADSQLIQELENFVNEAYGQTPKDDKGKFKTKEFIGKAGWTDQNGFHSQAFEDALSKCSDPSAKAAIQKAYDKLKDWAANHGDDNIAFDDIKNVINSSLDGAKQALSQGAELGMIGLQSIMSQRQTALQLTTNLVQSLGEQLKSIAGNIGK